MLEIFSNSVLQSFLFSPLMGVVFGALFAGLSARPSATATITVVETRRVFIERTRVNRRSQSDGGEVFGVAILMAFVVWKYLQFAPEVLAYIQMALISMTAFGLTCFFMSAIKGHFTSSDWFVRVAVPTAILVLCLMVLAIAKQKITPDLVALAQNNHITKFFTSLTQYGSYLVISHVLGVCLLVLVAIINTLNLLHYLSLMNQRNYSSTSNVWFFLTRITFRFSGKGAYIVTALFFTLSFLLVSGKIALWVTQ